MANPFKPDDKVQTKVKGTTVDAVVRLVWNDEVQVRTTDKALLWRSVKTVWYPGAHPQAETAGDSSISGQVTDPNAVESAVHSGAGVGSNASLADARPTTSQPAPETAPATTPPTAPPATPETAPPVAENSELNSAELPHSGAVQPAQGLISCGADDQPQPRHRKARKRK